MVKLTNQGVPADAAADRLQEIYGHGGISMSKILLTGSPVRPKMCALPSLLGAFAALVAVKELEYGYEHRRLNGLPIHGIS